MKKTIALLSLVGLLASHAARADEPITLITPQPVGEIKPINLNKRIITDKMDHRLEEILPAENSALENKLEKTAELNKNPFAFAVNRPNYVLPFYYTASPYYAAYQNATPNHQKIMSSELKAQFSVLVPVFRRLFYNPDASLNIAYTQLNYWQVYASSQFFRETNYEPEIFVQNHFHRNYLLRYGLDHQSNGLGGSQERSWNRAIASLQFSGEHWLASLKVWDLIFKANSSNLHNPSIAHYLGYENILFAYQFHKTNLSFQVQNIESGLRRGFFQISASYPLMNSILVYTQFFSGYGQSLIEYNHRTNAAGVGIAFNDVF
jgi:phospholipase A1